MIFDIKSIPIKEENPADTNHNTEDRNYCDEYSSLFKQYSSDCNEDGIGRREPTVLGLTQAIIVSPHIEVGFRRKLWIARIRVAFCRHASLLVPPVKGVDIMPHEGVQGKLP